MNHCYDLGIVIAIRKVCDAHRRDHRGKQWGPRALWAAWRKLERKAYRGSLRRLKAERRVQRGITSAAIKMGLWS